jgi:hypothetical protein
MAGATMATMATAAGERAGGGTATETETGTAAATISGAEHAPAEPGTVASAPWKDDACPDYGRAGDATPGAPRRGMAGPIAAFKAFWRGDVPLGRAFWIWGIVSGGIVSLACTTVALALLAGGAPGWLAIVVFAAHIPWNLVLLVGVWRSSEGSAVQKQTQQLARLAMVAWVLLLSAL